MNPCPALFTICVISVICGCSERPQKVPDIDLDAGVTIDTTRPSTGRPATPAQKAGLAMAITGLEGVASIAQLALSHDLDSPEHQSYRDNALRELALAEQRMGTQPRYDVDRNYYEAWTATREAMDDVRTTMGMELKKPSKRVREIASNQITVHLKEARAAIARLK